MDEKTNFLNMLKRLRKLKMLWYI